MGTWHFITFSLDKIFLLKIALVFGLIGALLFSKKLWKSPRVCPPIPVLSPLTNLPFEQVLFGLMFILLGGICVFERPVILIVAFLALMLLFCLYDWGRWSAWMYQYCFMLAAFGLYFSSTIGGAPEKELLNTCRLVIIGIYFWSGVHKLNASFVKIVFPVMMESFQTFANKKLKINLPILGYAAPLIEAGLAIGLLVPEARTISLVLALGMHAFILACVGPFGIKTNKSIWPWNLTMMAFDIILFAGAGNLGVKEILFGHSLFHGVTFVLFGLMPALGFVGLLDMHFSFKFFTGTHPCAALILSHKVFNSLPKSIQAHCVFTTRNHRSFYLLDVLDWYYKELDVHPYPEERVYKRIAGSFRHYGTFHDNDLTLVLWGSPSLFNTIRPVKTYSFSKLVEPQSRVRPLAA